MRDVRAVRSPRGKNNHVADSNIRLHGAPERFQRYELRLIIQHGFIPIIADKFDHGLVAIGQISNPELSNLSPAGSSGIQKFNAKGASR